jgi:hypothetical protein
MSAGESDSEQSQASDDIQQNDSYDVSGMGPIVDWGEVIATIQGQGNGHIDPDDMSTIAYSMHDANDSGQYGLLFAHDEHQLPSSVNSSHGTVEEFISENTCRICQLHPTTAVAHVIWSNWHTFRECRFHINGEG